MTVKDLLDQVAYSSGDNSGEFREAALRWLNFTRAYIASRGEWRSARVEDATLTTSASTTDGLYTLDGYEKLSGDWMFDETNGLTIWHESIAMLNGVDPGKDTTGNPAWWGDAGVDENQARQIYLWPIPDGEYTIRYPAYKLITDLSVTDESLSTDPFYGPISAWAATFEQGIQWYYHKDNNEDANIIFASKQLLDNMIKDRLSEQRVGRPGALQLGNVRTQMSRTAGRFDPAHYNNRR